MALTQKEEKPPQYKNLKNILCFTVFGTLYLVKFMEQLGHIW